MEAIGESTKLKRMLFFMFLLATLLIFNVSDEFREMLELVPFPNPEF